MKGFKDSHFPKCPGPEIQKIVYLYPGEYYFATNATMIHTILGSCVSVIFFDRTHHYGAMCHAVLDSDTSKRAVTECSKYMDCVINEMVSRFAQRGVSIQGLEVKMFGGAQMLFAGKKTSTSAASQPGAKNIFMARKILQEYNFRIIAEDCGGFQGRKVYFCSHTGDVFLKKIDNATELTV